MGLLSNRPAIGCHPKLFSHRFLIYIAIGERRTRDLTGLAIPVTIYHLSFSSAVFRMPQIVEVVKFCCHCAVTKYVWPNISPPPLYRLSLYSVSEFQQFFSNLIVLPESSHFYGGCQICKNGTKIRLPTGDIHMPCDRYKELDEKVKYHHKQSDHAFRDPGLTESERKRITKSHRSSEMQAKRLRGQHRDSCAECKAIS